MSEIRTEAEAGAMLAYQAQDIHKFEELEGLYGTVTQSGTLMVTNIEEALPAPRRKRGEATAGDPEAFIAYWHKHAGEEGEVWASRTRGAIVGVLNPHGPLGTGWADHRIHYTPQLSVGWVEWLSKANAFMTQAELAEHFEQRLPEIVDPDGATMLELAQSFQATRNVQFEEGKRLRSGETTLVYTEVDAAKAGRKGDIDIPDTFTIAVKVYEDGEPVRLTARFRYRITNQQLRVGYWVIDAEPVVRQAFDDLADAIGAGTETPVWQGEPV